MVEVGEARMASRLNPAQILTLISHISPSKFELVHNREMTLYFFNEGKPEGVATCELEFLGDIREGVIQLGYDLTDEWRGKGEGGFVYTRNT